MLYAIGRALYRALFRVVFRYSVQGLEHVPATGGVLLVANHASYLDPPLVGSALRRPVYFMAKAELFKIPILSWALPRVHAFPVQRGGADRSAVRTAIALLKEGHAVCLFPEGTRSKSGEMLPFERGAGLIALKAGVPVVPMALRGTVKPIAGLRPSRIVVKIGPALDLGPGASDGDRLSTDGAVERMRDAIGRMLVGS